MERVIATKRFDTLYRTARAFYEELLAFRPEMVIALAHSGRLPLSATRAIWRATQERPFPPTVSINLGREKQKPFALWRRIYNIHHPPHATDDKADIAQTLAWSAGRQRWRRELWQLVQAAWDWPGAPSRFLIIDDRYGSGRTVLLALGLMDAVFPESDVLLICGQPEWLPALFQIWLERHHPAVAARLRSPEAHDVIGAAPWPAAIRAAVSGTVDVHPDSLAWRPLAAGDSVLEPLLSFLPRQVLLETAPWLEATLDREMADRAEAGTLVAGGIHHWPLTPEWKLLSWTSRNCSVTAGQAAEILKVDLAQARARLEALVEERSLVRLSTRPDSAYTLCAAYEPDWSRFY